MDQEQVKDLAGEDTMRLVWENIHGKEVSGELHIGPWMNKQLSEKLNRKPREVTWMQPSEWLEMQPGKWLKTQLSERLDRRSSSWMMKQPVEKTQMSRQLRKQLDWNLMVMYEEGLNKKLIKESNSQVKYILGATNVEGRLDVVKQQPPRDGEPGQDSMVIPDEGERKMVLWKDAILMEPWMMKTCLDDDRKTKVTSEVTPSRMVKALGRMQQIKNLRCQGILEWTECLGKMRGPLILKYMDDIMIHGKCGTNNVLEEIINHLEWIDENTGRWNQGTVEDDGGNTEAKQPLLQPTNDWIFVKQD
jgi:hypothetical protein